MIRFRRLECSVEVVGFEPTGVGFVDPASAEPPP